LELITISRSHDEKMKSKSLALVSCLWTLDSTQLKGETMKNGIPYFLLLSLVSCLLALPGCSQESSTTTPQASNSASAVDGSKYLLDTEPEDVKGVIKVREEAKDQDDVVIVGRIGGSEVPWIEGMAAFTIVDPLTKHCGELGDDGCPKPWDFCWGDRKKLSSSTALIKVVDENGSPVKADARGLLNVKELTTVVVKGKAQRDDAGNLTILATGVYVKK
jgi:hypothetical protein